jgi:AAA15 family ATPase/GTPase
MNSIKNIEINNFKSIRHQKIDGCKRINVFIGYPNVGKSNILEALSLYSIDKPYADFSSFVRAEELTTLFFDGNVDERIEIRINNNNRITAGLFESNKMHFFWQLAGTDASFDKMRPSVQQNIYDILNFFKAEGEDKVEGWDSVFTRQPRSDDFLNKLKEEGQLAAVKKYSFQKNIAYLSGRYDSLAVPNGENIFDIIYTHSDIRAEIASLFEVYDLKLLYNSTDKKFSILKSLDKDTIFTIPYKLIADTLQRLIFYTVAIAKNKDSILIFEEPEAHMFPPYVRKFTSDVVFDKSNQFFITTHSPYVLDALMEEAPEDLSIYLVYYENGETKVKLMSEKDMEEVNEYGVDLFYNLESYLKHGQVNNA